MHYNLPPWSISILPDCRNAVFNTAKVCTKSLRFESIFLWYSGITIMLPRTQFYTPSVSSSMVFNNLKLYKATKFIFSSVRLECKHLRCKCCQQILICSHGRDLRRTFLLLMTALQLQSLLLVSWNR